MYHIQTVMVPEPKIKEFPKQNKVGLDEEGKPQVLDEVYTRDSSRFCNVALGSGKSKPMRRRSALVRPRQRSSL